MSANPDRLYELLPAIYRIRDKEQGEPLRALLSTINEQVDLIEDNIAQTYDNWFIETCEDWVVPYLADLIGYRPVHPAGVPVADATQDRVRNKILTPRREVANTLRYRRRKGTLALLELLANDIADWPARAVEFRRLLSRTQVLNYLHLDHGRTVDLHDVKALELLGTPFDELAHTVDVRRVNSQHSQGCYNIPSVGLFVWRLQSFPVTCTPAYCVESSDSQLFTFSVLGNDTPLFVKPEAESDPMHIAEAFNLPVPVSRRLLDRDIEQAKLEQGEPRLYGEDNKKSICIWKGYKSGKKIVLKPIRYTEIKVADLSGWRYLPKRGEVALDPELGRIAFPSYPPVANGVWVTYQYGFSTAMAGGEYERPAALASRGEMAFYLVAETGGFSTLKQALAQWEKDDKAHAVIEIADNRVYVEQLHVDFNRMLENDDGQTGKLPSQRKSLCIRAAKGKRPVIRLLDWQTSQSDALTITGNQAKDQANRFTLEGLLVMGRGIQLDGELQKVTIHHSTLVPGWDVDADCHPKRPLEPSLEIFSPNVCVDIRHSIVGAIQVNPMVPATGDESFGQIMDESKMAQARCQGIGADYRLDPVRLCISDSIVDATGPEREAIGAPGCPVAHAVLNIQRCTVIGQVQVHAIEKASNSIFMGSIHVARRQFGCLRFSYVTPGSRTPTRYHCQPPAEANNSEQVRLKPRFNNTHYGTPSYCQLAESCAAEIRCGADDESEMGVFHDLFQPQREANLRVRLDEYIPAGADVGIIKVN